MTRAGVRDYDTQLSAAPKTPAPAHLTCAGAFNPSGENAAAALRRPTPPPHPHSLYPHT